MQSEWAKNLLSGACAIVLYGFESQCKSIVSLENRIK